MFCHKAKVTQLKVAENSLRHALRMKGPFTLKDCSSSTARVVVNSASLTVQCRAVQVVESEQNGALGNKQVKSDKCVLCSYFAVMDYTSKASVVSVGLF